MEINILRGKFLDYALHSLIWKIKDATLKGEYILRMFVDLWDFPEIWDATGEHGIDDTLMKWVYAMLGKSISCGEVGDVRYLTTSISVEFVGWLTAM